MAVHKKVDIRHAPLVVLVCFTLMLVIFMTGCGPMVGTGISQNNGTATAPSPIPGKQGVIGSGHQPVSIMSNPTATATAQSVPTAMPQPSGPVVVPPAVGATGTVYRTNVTPLAQEEFATANYTLWIPKNATAVRGVIVWGPWCGGSDLGDGIPADGTAYLGSKYNLAYLGQTLTHKDGTRNCHESYADKGSGTALFRALNQFATLAQHAEIAQAPLIVEGMSITASWALVMLKNFPDRVAAGFARGIPDGGTLVPAAAAIPLMITSGEKDPFTSGDVTDFHVHRALGAPWALAVTPNEGHTWNHYTTDFETVYLDAVIPLRISTTPGALLKVDTAQGWIGDNTTYQITPVAQYTGNALQASWLPDQNSALAWQHMVMTAKL